MTILDIKKYFTKNSSVNFLNEFTLQDVEDAKKMIYMKNYKTHGESLKVFLDGASDRLAKDRFYASVPEDQGVHVKNTVRDVLNANYKNTITRLILIDSQYRPRLYEDETNFIVQLNEKVVNAVSLEVLNIQIPYTFYNIEQRQGNNRFMLTQKNTNSLGQVTYEEHPIQLDTGFYSTLESMITGLNDAIQLIDLNVELRMNANTRKMSMVNRGTNDYIVHFLIDSCKINQCLGWHLGFRSFQGSNLANQTITLDYTLNANQTILANAVAVVPHTKYFVLVLDDFNNNQTADTMIQSNIKPENSKPSSYFTQDPCLGALTPENLPSYLANVPNRTLTKSQLFTISQQNLEKINLGVQNTRLEVHAPNQVIAVIPFEETKVKWGDLYFADKNKYIREYHSPTNIDRLHVKIYDDKGYLLQLNGANWCMSILTNNLYKY